MLPPMAGGKFSLQQNDAMRIYRKTKAEYLQALKPKYRKAGQQWPASAIMVAEWAIREGLWEPHPRSVLRQCAREIADAFREEY